MTVIELYSARGRRARHVRLRQVLVTAAIPILSAAAAMCARCRPPCSRRTHAMQCSRSMTPRIFSPVTWMPGRRKTWSWMACIQASSAPRSGGDHSASLPRISNALRLVDPVMGDAGESTPRTHRSVRGNGRAGRWCRRVDAELTEASILTKRDYLARILMRPRLTLLGALWSRVQERGAEGH